MKRVFLLRLKSSFCSQDIKILVKTTCNTHVPQIPGKVKAINETMKLGQVTEYNMRNIFLKKSNLSISQDK